MNDDYLFTAPISPRDLFGPSCSGVRVLVENRAVHSVSEEDYLTQLETARGRTWPLSVLHSVVSLDKHYNRDASYNRQPTNHSLWNRSLILKLCS